MKKPILFVGLDVDTQAFHGYAFSEEEGVLQSAFRANPNSGALIQKLKQFKAKGFELRVCYEAGYLGFSLQRDLKKQDIHCDVIAPSLIPKESSDTVKTDRLDAKKLAKYHRAGLLTPVHIPGVEQEADRDLIRSRSFLVSQLKSVKLHFLSQCRRVGLDYRLEQKKPTAHYWTGIHWRWLEPAVNRAELPKSVRLNLNLLIEHIRQIQIQVDAYDKQILLLGESENYKPSVEALCCYRGIKILTALSLILEIGDIRRFSHPRRLTSYVGMDIREYSSAGKHHRMSITKLGNCQIRTNVVESCQTANRPPRVSEKLKLRRKNTPSRQVAIADRCMKRLYQKSSRLLQRGKTPNKVKVACAREMLGFVWESLCDVQKQESAISQEV